MSTLQQSQQETVEECENCGTETTHRVSVELVTESEKETNAAFSREPYRITECVQCGSETRQRMNNM